MLVARPIRIIGVVDAVGVAGAGAVMWVFDRAHSSVRSVSEGGGEVRSSPTRPFKRTVIAPPSVSVVLIVNDKLGRTAPHQVANVWPDRHAGSRGKLPPRNAFRFDAAALLSSSPILPLNFAGAPMISADRPANWLATSSGRSGRRSILPKPLRLCQQRLQYRRAGMLALLCIRIARSRRCYDWPLEAMAASR